MKYMWEKKIRRIVAVVLVFLMVVQATGLQVLAAPEEETPEETGIPVGVVSNYHYIDEGVPRFSEEEVGIQPYAISALPSSYSSSDKCVGEFEQKENWVTPVRIQQGGTCWAYTSTSLAETNYVMNNLGGSSATSDNVDFDDMRLAYFTYNTPLDPLGLTAGDGTRLPEAQNYASAGGSCAMALRMYANWVGASNESGFDAANVTESNATELAYNQDVAHLENGYIITMPDVNGGNYQQDMEAVKRMIMNYGSVAVSFYAGIGTGGYYYESQKKASNHGVAVVGWNDNIPKENFPITPPGDGAWLVKNSWGTDSGIQGYYWLSYYDATIENSAYAWDFGSADNYDNNYQYDGTGNSGSYMMNDNQFTAANAFVADSNEILKAVSFYTMDLNVEYEVRIYKGLSADGYPQTGTLACTQGGQEVYAGYHTVELDSPISLQQGERYAVVVTLKKSGSVVRFAIDSSADIGWVAYSSSAKKGQSYAGVSLNYISDLNSSNQLLGDGINVRIKAFTDEDIPVNVTGVILNKTSATLNVGGTLQLSATVTPDNASNKAVVWKSDNPAVATVNSNGVVSGVKGGTANITVTTVDGSKTATCTVTVVRTLTSLEKQYASIYNFDYYCEKYSDIKRVYGDNPDGALQHFINFGMKEGRQGCASFQVQSYYNKYADLRRAFKNDLPSYYKHYMNYGKKEGRTATGVGTMQNYATVYNGVNYALVYDYNYYVGKYGDIKKAFGADDAKALEHFVKYGMKEGRQGCDSFQVQSYYNKYADLRRAFKNDLPSYYKHYMNYGKKEGRTATGVSTMQNYATVYKGVNYALVYDYNYYVGKYGDIKKAFGADDAKALEHFVKYGMKEGRQGSAAFNVYYYKANYRDLQNAFGNNLPSYYKHYMNYGKRENRIADRRL